MPPNPTGVRYKGYLDDIAVYNKILSTEEVGYLYDLRMGREQIPRLDVVVDAVGAVDINESGAGYRENPDLTLVWQKKINLICSAS